MRQLRNFSEHASVMTDKVNYFLQFAFSLCLFYSGDFLRFHIAHKIFLRLYAGLTTFFHTHFHSPSVRIFASIPPRYFLTLFSRVFTHSRIYAYISISLLTIFSCVCVHISIIFLMSTFSPFQAVELTTGWDRNDASVVQVFIARKWRVVILVSSFRYAPICLAFVVVTIAIYRCEWHGMIEKMFAKNVW